MSSVSVSTLILFIAAMLVAAGVAGTLVSNVNQVTNSIDDHSMDVREKIDTDIAIISDPGSDAVYDANNTTVTVLIKNTGEKTLPEDAGRLDVLVDGRYVAANATNLTVLEDAAWRSGAVARLEIDRALDPGEHRVTVVVNGDEEVFEFYLDQT